MEGLKSGWFEEKNDLWPGESKSYEVETVLHHEKSKFQDILFLKTKTYGKALILDGIVQCTERDEFAYQEMISFLPLNAHENPEKVLIVGGGDGGVAREVTKHPLVKEIVQVEIDGRVVELSKKFLPNMAKGFSSTKLRLEICDGFRYLKENKGEFDVIITDSSDPVGPAVNLFTENYFQLLRDSLKPNGIITSQVGNLWQDLEFMKKTFKACKNLFKVAKIAYTMVPTYPTGQLCFLLASIDGSNDVSVPKHFLSDAQMNLKYYNSEIHKSAFVLPNFAKSAFV